MPYNLLPNAPVDAQGFYQKLANSVAQIPQVSVRVRVSGFRFSWLSLTRVQGFGALEFDAPQVCTVGRLIEVHPLNPHIEHSEEHVWISGLGS